MGGSADKKVSLGKKSSKAMSVMIFGNHQPFLSSPVERGNTKKQEKKLKYPKKSYNPLALRRGWARFEKTKCQEGIEFT